MATTVVANCQTVMTDASKKKKSVKNANICQFGIVENEYLNTRFQQYQTDICWYLPPQKFGNWHEKRQKKKP